MVPDVVPREVIALAGVHPSNRSLKTTKDALVGLFHGFPHPLSFLGVDDFRVSIDRKQLLPVLTCLRKSQKKISINKTIFERNLIELETALFFLLANVIKNFHFFWISSLRNIFGIIWNIVHHLMRKIFANSVQLCSPDLTP